MKEEELRCILKLEKENSELVKKVKIGIKRLLNQNDQKDKEIERLNNIIDKLEKDLEDIFYGRGQHFMDSSVVPIKYVLDKLKELKGEN